MSQGIFLDRDRPPDRAGLEAGLGDGMELWDRLVDWIEATYGVSPDPLFYGRNTGWVIRYRRSGRSLAVLSPERGSARVTVVIGPTVADQVEGLELGPAARAALDAAHPYPDGRWLTIELRGAEDVEDVTRLIALKSPPPRRPPARRAMAAHA